MSHTKTEFIFRCELHYNFYSNTHTIAISAETVALAYEKLCEEAMLTPNWVTIGEEDFAEYPVSLTIHSEKKQGLNLEYFEEKGDLQIETDLTKIQISCK